MKTYQNILAAAALMLGLAGCSEDALVQQDAKQQQPLVEVTLGANFAATRTTMNGDGQVLWSEGDQIKVQVGTNAYDFTVVSGAGTQSATFKGSVTFEDAAILRGETQGTTVTACYPTSGAAVPASQEFAAGTFADGAFPMTATFENLNLTFSANAAVVRVQGVSGSATSATLSYTVSETNYSVTLNNITETTITKDLYFVVVPGAKDFNLTIGSSTSKYSAAEITEIGHRYTLLLDAAIAKIIRGKGTQQEQILFSTGSHLNTTGDFGYVLDYGEPCVQTGDYVYLLQDINGDKSDSQISMEKSWTLDLNGHYLKQAIGTNDYFDTFGSQVAILWAQGQSNPGTNRIVFEDSSNGKTGLIENTSTDGKKYSAAISINSQAGATELVFNDGTYKSNVDAIYMEKGLVSINGGTFEGLQNCINVNIAATSAYLSQLTINDGLFKGNLSLANKTSPITSESYRCHATINGGIFENGLKVGKDVDLTISGGKFKTSEGSKYVIDGKVLVDDSGYFTVKDASYTPATCTANLNNKAYFTSVGGADLAITQAVSGDVIYLFENSTTGKTIHFGEDYTYVGTVTYTKPVAVSGYVLVEETLPTPENAVKFSVKELKPFKASNGVEYDADQLETALGQDLVITVQRDVTVTSQKVYVGKGTLDLNGHTVTFTSTGSGYGILYTDGGTTTSRYFTIKDSSGGKGWLVATNLGSGKTFIKKCGKNTFTFESGNVRCPSGWIFCEEGYSGYSTFKGGHFEGQKFDFGYNKGTKITGPMTIVTTDNNGVNNHESIVLSSGLIKTITNNGKEMTVTAE